MTPRKPRYFSDTKYLLLHANFITNLAFFSMMTILTLYLTQTCQFNLTYAGAVMFFVLLISRAGRLLLLPFLKHYQPRQALILSSVLMCCGFFLLFLSQIKLIMLAAFFLLGVGYGCNSTYVRSLIGSLCCTNKDEEKLIYVRLSTVTNLSAAIGSLLAAYVFSQFHGQYVFCYSTFLLLLNLIIIYLYFPVMNNQIPTLSLFNAIKFILNHRAILNCLCLTFASWIVYVQIFSALPLLVNNQLHATRFLGSIYAVNTALIVLFSMRINKFLIKLNCDGHELITLGILFMTAGFLLIYILPSLVMTYVAMTLWTIAEILIVPALSSILSSHLQGPERLHVFAINSVVMGMGEGLGMYLGTLFISLHPKLPISHIYLNLTLLACSFIGLTILMKYISDDGSNSISLQTK